MIVKPSEFKIIPFRKLSSYVNSRMQYHKGIIRVVPRRQSHTPPPPHDRRLVLRQNTEGNRTFLNHNNQESPRTTLRLGVKQIGVKPIKIAHTILKTKSLPNFLPPIM